MEVELNSQTLPQVSGGGQLGLWCWAGALGTQGRWMGRRLVSPRPGAT